jgi:hypothetical protein
MQTPFSTVRTVAHNLKIIAILKLQKLALCPMAAITTQSQREEDSYYLVIGEGANKPANAPTAADPKAIKPSGMVAAVLKLKMKPPMMVKRTADPRKATTKRKIHRSD